MYRKLLITRFFRHLAIFGIYFCCRLMNIFLTQFWTVKLLIHKPQPCHMTKQVSTVIFTMLLPFQAKTCPLLPAHQPDLTWHFKERIFSALGGGTSPWVHCQHVQHQGLQRTLNVRDFFRHLSVGGSLMFTEPYAQPEAGKRGGSLASVFYFNNALQYKPYHVSKYTFSEENTLTLAQNCKKKQKIKNMTLLVLGHPTDSLFSF